jgi:dihydropteroate synthase
MMTTELSSCNLKTYKLTTKVKVLELGKPIVMGILNVTPDSFYDGGKHGSEEDIILQVEKMLNEGAAIIDIGAVSSRPGARDISEEEEWLRLKPVLKSAKRKFKEAVFSIDTYRSKIARMAILEGANMVNDISGGVFDKYMAETIASLKVPYVMMHMKGNPQSMQHDPQYKNVVNEVKIFFERQLQNFKQAGASENIILDPGFGFGKTTEHNYTLLKNLNVFHDFGFPIMVGISRKSMINRIINTKPEEALNGTTALNVIALLNGANILRVHDVKQAIEAIKLVEFYKNVV